jgi:hypothetical protein
MGSTIKPVQKNVIHYLGRLRYLVEGHAKGKVIIAVEPDNKA